MTLPRAKISASLADRGRPEMWANEQESAALSGMSVEDFRRKLPDLLRAGFPKPARLNGAWSIAMIVQFWTSSPPRPARLAEVLKNPVIYFVRAKESGRIKIGFSNNPKKRLSAIATHCPEHVEIIGTMPGSQYHERKLHERFAAARVMREWFAPTDELLAYIAEVAK